MLQAEVILCFWSQVNFALALSGVCFEFHTHLPLKIVNSDHHSAKAKTTLVLRPEGPGWREGKRQGGREQGPGWPLFPWELTGGSEANLSASESCLLSFSLSETLPALRRGRQLLGQLFSRLGEAGGRAVRKDFSAVRLGLGRLDLCL